MIGKKQLRSHIFVLSIALSLAWVILPAVPTQAEVTWKKIATVPSNSESLESLLQVNFETPDTEDEQPKETVGAGSRDTGKSSARAKQPSTD